MVFFTCNGCGESLKKAQVDKHVSFCRGCQSLSCIDCGKDFWGDDYKNHLKCISEDQKYGGKGFEAKANKGDVKQQQWLERINEAMNKPGVSAKLKDVLRQVSAYDNVPRKKGKFQNWMRNSLKIANTSLHDEVWGILAEADKQPLKAPQETIVTKPSEPEVKVDANGAEEQNGNSEIRKKLNKRERKEARQQKNGKAVKGSGKSVTQEPEQELVGKKKKKDRKRKHNCEEEQDGLEVKASKKLKTVSQSEEADEVQASEEADGQEVSNGKFNWKGNIKAVLSASPDKELAMKKLKKKVLAAYYSFTGEQNFKTEEEVLSIFNKKINKNPKFRVLKDRVRLVN